jgi:hypothetical protein
MEFDRKKQPDDRQGFQAESLLGASLAGQKKCAEAEPLLLEGYQGMQARKDRMVVEDRYYLDRAREWIVQLYQAWSKPAKAAEWKKKRGSATGERSSVTPHSGIAQLQDVRPSRSYFFHDFPFGKTQAPRRSAARRSQDTRWRKCRFHPDAVGTTITDRPPHRTVRAPLCIRLPPWMSGGESLARIRMQDAGNWNPVREDRRQPIPGQHTELTATTQYQPPQSA